MGYRMPAVVLGMQLFFFFLTLITSTNFLKKSWDHNEPTKEGTYVFGYADTRS